MAGDIIAGVVSEFVNAVAAGEVEKAVAYCADDASWIVPEGTLSGNKEIQQYLAHLKDSNKNISINDTGIDLIVQGSEAIHEYIFKGTTKDGMPWTLLALTIYEFNSGKIKRMTTVFDRLALVKQTARSWFTRMAVNRSVNFAERGMR